MQSLKTLGDVLIKFAMLAHMARTMVQIQAQMKKRVTVMKNMKRTLVMRVRLGKDDMTMMITKRSRKKSRKRKDMMSLLMIWNMTLMIDLPT